MHSLLDMLNGGEIGEEELSFFLSNVHRKCVIKGEILQVKGDISHKLFFVRSGLLRSYVIDQQGKEHIFMFAPEGWIIADTVSGTYNTPSDLFIDAIEDSELEVWDKDVLEKVVAQRPMLSLSGSDKLARRVAVLQQRVIMLMSATAWERYEHFVQTYPNIVQRVPQKMIASYLGITPEALSKIRGDNARRK